jgi:hypothetical protein
MSNEPNVQPDVSDQPIVSESEFDALKARANILGIAFHPRIGVESLRERINNILATDENEAQGNAPVSGAVVSGGMSKDEFNKSQRQSTRRKALSLVRIRVSCMNPNKKDWEGEVFSTGSAKLGTIKKFVPFNSDEPYHVPRIIFDMMKERKCTVFKTVRDHRGNKIRKASMVNEFAIEELPPLTPTEIKELAQRQAMSGGIE